MLRVDRRGERHLPPRLHSPGERLTAPRMLQEQCFQSAPLAFLYCLEFLRALLAVFAVYTLLPSAGARGADLDAHDDRLVVEARLRHGRLERLAAHLLRGEVLRRRQRRRLVHVVPRDVRVGEGSERLGHNPTGVTSLEYTLKDTSDLEDVARQ